MAHYHPTDEMLLDYATGAQNPATALLIACHLTFCPQCRRKNGFFDLVGGVLLQQAPPAELFRPPVTSGTTLPSRKPRTSGTGGIAVPDDMVLPRPLLRHTGCAAADLPWRRLMPGIFEVPLAFGGSEAEARLMRIMPGCGVPRHTHQGTETTLVLSGAYSDESGHYERGDVTLADGTVDHRPVADIGEPCLCLAVTDAPLRLTGILGRIAKFLGMRGSE